MLRIYVPERTQDDKWKLYLRNLKKTSEQIELYPCAYHSPAEQRQWAQDFIMRVVMSKELYTLVTTNEIIIREIQLYLAKHPRHITLVHIRFITMNTKEIHMQVQPNGFFAQPWPNSYFDVSYQQSKDLLYTNHNVTD